MDLPVLRGPATGATTEESEAARVRTSHLEGRERLLEIVEDSFVEASDQANREEVPQARYARD